MEYWAWIMGRFCAEALTVLDDGCRVLDYADITPDIARSVGEYFQLSFSEEGQRRLSEAFRFNAKNPSRVFQRDSADKLTSASDAIRMSTVRWAEGPYQELRKRAAAWDRI